MLDLNFPSSGVTCEGGGGGWASIIYCSALDPRYNSHLISGGMCCHNILWDTVENH